MEETKTTAIVKMPDREMPTPGSLLQTALEHGAGVEQLERLLALQERWDATQARIAYVKAMAAFKADPPRIIKDKHVNAGRASYSHASLAHIINEVTPALSARGLHAAWTTGQDKIAITVSCTLTHEQGHCESVSLCGPPDNSGAKNPIQQVGSTVTYLQRYTLLALLGLATEDNDDADQLKPAHHEDPAPQPGARPPVEPAASKRQASKAQLERLRGWVADTSLPPQIRGWVGAKLEAADKRGTPLTQGEAGSLIGKVEARLVELASAQPEPPPAGSDAPADDLFGGQPEPPREREPGED